MSFLSDKKLVSLVHQVKLGDQPAFERLFRFFKPYIKWKSLLLSQVDLREDLAQELMLKLWGCAKSFHITRTLAFNAARFTSLVKVSLHNQFNDFLRRYFRSQQYIADVDYDFAQKLVHRDVYFDDVGWLMKTFRVLGLTRRELIFFILLSQGYSISEVAAKMGVGAGALKKALFRARAKARQNRGNLR